MASYKPTLKMQEAAFEKTDKKIKDLVEPTPVGGVNASAATFRGEVGRDTEDSPQKHAILTTIVRDMRNLFIATLYMLKTRGGYDYKGFLDSVKTRGTPEDFFDAIMSSSYHNPVRNIFHELYKMNMKRPTNIRKVFIKLSMSFLVCNPSGNFTGVFFIPKGTEQQSSVVTIAVVRDVAYTIGKLMSIANIPINEVIIVSAGKLSPEALGMFSCLSSKDVFIQFFNEMDIVVPAVSSIFSSKIEKAITRKEDIEEFLAKNRIFDARNLRPISHKKDPVLKYLGVRPNTILKLRRPEVIPGDITEDSCYVVTV